MVKRMVFIAAALVAACQTKRAPDPTPPVSASVAEAAPSASIAAPVTASAAPKRVHPLAGNWRAKYTSKKGQVVVSQDVKDHVREADDGKRAIGEGTISISIDDTGDIRGKMTGALGDANITGNADDDTIRCGIFPERSGGDSMAGVLYATVAGAALKGDVRVSGDNGEIVREASIELARER